MSSSKSVAAARARRATETPAQRPRSSIGSFAQAPPPPPQFTPQKNPRMAQQQQQQQYASQQQQQKPKISIGNAIALVSLRIGRLEQMLQENSEGGLSLAVNVNDNKQSSDALDNIMNRLVLLENKPTFDRQGMDEVLSKLSRENKEIKDNFQKMVQQFNHFIKETNDKFLDYEAAFVDIEQKMKSFVEEEIMEEVHQTNQDENDTNQDENGQTTILSEDIKSEILKL